MSNEKNTLQYWINQNQKLKTEIKELKTKTTKRPVVPELEKILLEEKKCLDHGFIRVIDYMGDQKSITQAARVSYKKGTKKLRNDIGLIRYLLRKRHSTPFEMNEIKFHMKMPIFVARQIIRTRTASTNEISARYSILDKEFYLPEPNVMAKQSKTNNQGRGEVLDEQQSAIALQILKSDALGAYETYEKLLGDEFGLARELARMNLPVNFYTQWYWKIDLHNLIHFLKLRADPHAQYEIRVYAEAMIEVLKRWVPLTHNAFSNYVKEGVSLSSKGLDVIKKKLSGKNIDQASSGLGAREWAELMALLEQ